MTAKRKPWQTARALYYRHVYGRPMLRPVAAFIERMDQRRGDIPKPAEAWDQDYRAGKWDFMEERQFRHRYSVLVGLLEERHSVLDVGCGTGILYRRMMSSHCDYTGIDISRDAIESAASLYPRGTFFPVSAEEYQGGRPYAAIVFNETLYYIADPVAQVRRYARYLTPSGVIIVSMYLESPRAAAIMRQLRQAFAVEEEVLITHDNARTVVAVLKERRE